MQNRTVRVIVDGLMYVALCCLTGTGLLLHFRLLPGFRGGRGMAVLGLSRHEWGDFHLWAAYLVLFLILVHLALNFAFIKNCIAARRTWVVIVLGLIGVVITSVFLLLPREQRGEEARGHGMMEQLGDEAQGHGMRLRGGEGRQGWGRQRDGASR